MWNLIPLCGPLAPNNLEPQTLRFSSCIFTNSAVGIPKQGEVIGPPPPEFLNSGTSRETNMKVAMDWDRKPKPTAELHSTGVSKSEGKEARDWRSGSYCHLAGTHSEPQSNLGKLPVSFGADPKFIHSFWFTLHLQYAAQCTQWALSQCWINIHHCHYNH